MLHDGYSMNSSIERQAFTKRDSKPCSIGWLPSMSLFLKQLSSGKDIYRNIQNHFNKHNYTTEHNNNNNNNVNNSCDVRIVRFEDFAKPNLLCKSLLRFVYDIDIANERYSIIISKTKKKVSPAIIDDGQDATDSRSVNRRSKQNEDLYFKATNAVCSKYFSTASAMTRKNKIVQSTNSRSSSILSALNSNSKSTVSSSKRGVIKVSSRLSRDLEEHLETNYFSKRHNSSSSSRRRSEIHFKSLHDNSMEYQNSRDDQNNQLRTKRKLRLKYQNDRSARDSLEFKPEILYTSGFLRFKEFRLALQRILSHQQKQKGVYYALLL
jgi:hypothetical protein